MNPIVAKYLDGELSGSEKEEFLRQLEYDVELKGELLLAEKTGRKLREFSETPDVTSYHLQARTRFHERRSALSGKKRFGYRLVVPAFALTAAAFVIFVFAMGHNDLDTTESILARAVPAEVEKSIQVILPESPATERVLLEDAEIDEALKAELQLTDQSMKHVIRDYNISIEQMAESLDPAEYETFSKTFTTFLD